MKKIIALTLLTVFVFSCSVTGVFAADLSAAEAAVVAAETAKTQTTIDAAQVLISKVAPSDERTALEERIDTVQHELDADIFDPDHENPLSGWSEIETGRDDIVGPYSLIDYDKYDFDKVSVKFKKYDSAFLSQPFTIEHSFKYSGAVGDGYHYMYGLWGIKPDVKSVMAGTWSALQSFNMQKDVWYKIKYEHQGSKGTITVSNYVTGEVLLTIADIPDSGTDFGSGIFRNDGLWYHLDDLTKGKAYYGPVIVSGVTADKLARNNVVKAERSLDPEDLEVALAGVADLESGSVKTALQARLDATKAIVDAQAALKTANASKLQSDIDAAIDLIDVIPEDYYIKAPMVATYKRLVGFTDVTYSAGSLAEGELTVSVYASSNTTDPKTAQLVVALYKEVDGVLQMVDSVKSEEVVALALDDPKLLTATIDIPEISDGTYKVMTFIYDSVSGLKPLATHKVFE